MAPTTTTRRPRRRPRPTAGQEQLAQRLGRRTGKNTPLDPAAGREGDPRTKLRRATRGAWKHYVRVQMRKDRAFALLRDATEPAVQVQLAEQIAAHDRELADLDRVLADLEDQLHPLAPTLSA